MALKRLIVLAAGAGAVWYARQKLGENGGSAQPPQQAQGPGRTEPQPVDPPIETTAFQEPEIELRPTPELGGEPPVAFEDARQEGWDDEQLGEDPKNLDELEIDPATAEEADEDAALEEAEELPEDEHDRTIKHGRTEPAHVTRVVDDLLEGRRDELDEAEIEDATLVEEERDQRSS